MEDKREVKRAYQGFNITRPTKVFEEDQELQCRTPHHQTKSIIEFLNDDVLEIILRRFIKEARISEGQRGALQYIIHKTLKVFVFYILVCNCFYRIIQQTGRCLTIRFNPLDVEEQNEFAKKSLLLSSTCFYPYPKSDLTAKDLPIEQIIKWFVG